VRSRRNEGPSTRGSDTGRKPSNVSGVATEPRPGPESQYQQGRTRYNIVDSQIHLTHGLAAVDDLGIQAAIIDEFWGYDESSSEPKPGHRLENSAYRSCHALRWRRFVTRIGSLIYRGEITETPI
jgi:hypothetical protein